LFALALTTVATAAIYFLYRGIQYGPQGRCMTKFRRARETAGLARESWCRQQNAFTFYQWSVTRQVYFSVWVGNCGNLSYGRH